MARTDGGSERVEMQGIALLVIQGVDTGRLSLSAEGARRCSQCRVERCDERRVWHRDEL